MRACGKTNKSVYGLARSSGVPGSIPSPLILPQDNPSSISLITFGSHENDHGLIISDLWLASSLSSH
jgi:hypothetical protein